MDRIKFSKPVNWETNENIKKALQDQKVISNLKENKLSDAYEIIISEFTYSWKDVSAFTAMLIDCGVDIFKYLSRIPRGCFYDLPLSEVYIPTTIKQICINAFCGTTLEKIIVPGSVYRVGVHSLGSCYFLTEIELEEGVEILNKMAISSCVNLKYVYLPKSLQRIDDGNFRNCPDVVVICHEGSYAHEWCEDNYINFKIH